MHEILLRKYFQNCMRTFQEKVPSGTIPTLHDKHDHMIATWYGFAR